LSCPEDDDYDSDSTGESVSCLKKSKKSILEEFKEDFKFIRKTTKGFCAEFESLNPSASVFNLAEDDVNELKKGPHTSITFKEDLVIFEEKVIDTILPRKGSILERLRSSKTDMGFRECI
jgi:hypothetical protein